MFFEKYCLTNPMMFSLRPRSQALYGLSKIDIRLQGAADLLVKSELFTIIYSDGQNVLSKRHQHMNDFIGNQIRFFYIENDR